MLNSVWRGLVALSFSNDQDARGAEKAAQLAEQKARVRVRPPARAAPCRREFLRECSLFARCFWLCCCSQEEAEAEAKRNFQARPVREVRRLIAFTTDPNSGLGVFWSSLASAGVGLCPSIADVDRGLLLCRRVIVCFYRFLLASRLQLKSAQTLTGSRLLY